MYSYTQKFMQYQFMSWITAREMRHKQSLISEKFCEHYIHVCTATFS
jgi:hypothetical protein